MIDKYYIPPGRSIASMFPDMFRDDDPAPPVTASLTVGSLRAPAQPDDGARARAAYLAEVMRTPSCVGMPVQPSNVAAPWSAIIAKVEAEQPRHAMTPQSAADPHGWGPIIAAVAAESEASSVRPDDSNDGWAAAFHNAKP
jgi:hypothetical protein